MTTHHLGDCSSECEICARRCARREHDECIGTEEQRRWGDSLLKKFIWGTFAEDEETEQ